MPAGAAVTAEVTDGAPIPANGQEATTVTPSRKPAKAKGTRAMKVFATEEEMGGPDILSFIVNEAGGLVSKSSAKRQRGSEWWKLNASLYDDAAKLARPHHNVIYSDSGQYPDQIAQAAYDARVIKEPTVNALWEAIKAASAKRGNAYQVQRQQEEHLQTQTKFASATAQGDMAVTAEDLKPGDTFEVDGEPFTVKRVDPTTGEVTLDDGKVFGRQYLSAGQQIWVEQPSDGLTERVAGADGGAQFAAGGDLFGAPESVEEQKERLRVEKLRVESRKAKESMIERAGARLVADEDTRTGDMFASPEGRSTRQDKAGQGSLFAAGAVMPPKFALNNPIKGPTGASIVGYEWRSTMGEKFSAREGGMVEARVSDWDNADESTGTGRAIVHVFYVAHPDGTVKPEGIRSAQNVLGISETRLMTIAKKERAAQQYRQDQERAEMASYDKASASTAQEAARDYRKWNYSPMRTFEENNEAFNESALFEKDGKFIRRNWKTAERMQRNGWTLLKDDPARTSGTTKAIDSVRAPEPEKQLDRGRLNQGSLFKAGSKATGTPRTQIQNVVAGLQREMPKAAPTTVVNTPEELPAAVQSAAAKQGVRLAGVKGLLLGNRVYLVASNLANPAEAQSIWLHEQVGHFATDAQLGAELRDFMGQVHDSFKGSQLMADVRARYPKADRVTLGREVVARLAEAGNTNPGAFKRLLAMFRAWLRKLGLVRQVSENDLRVMLQRAAESLRGGETATVQEVEQPAMAADARNLIAVHNTRADGLMHAMKMGGLAVPSIAIVRADKAVLEGFGDITLVGTPEMVTPSKDTKVLNADAYSPRYPKVDIIISYGDAKKVTAAFQKYRDEVPAAAGDYEWQASQVTEKITDRGWRELQYSSLARYAFLRDKGLMEAPAAGTDIEAVRQEVDRRTKGRESEIAAWAELKVKNLVPVSEKIFKGFTNSGNRSYIPHTLENVVKIMKKGFADAEGFNYGVGSVRAKTGKQFRSLEGIQKDRDKIIPKAQMEALKEEVDKEFMALHDYAMPYRTGGKNSGFGTLDAFSDDLKAMAEGGGENFRHLREMYPGGEPFQKMREFLDKLRNLPTEYFEAKPRRAVQLQEFTGAVVPEGTSPDLIKQLERRGLEVKTYPKNDNEARRAAVEAIGQERGALFAAGEAEQSEFAKLQADITAAEQELMAAIRQTVLPPDQRQGTRADVFAAKNDAHRKLRDLLAKQLKMMTDIRNLDAARSPEETANLISQTVDLLNSIQDEISERTAKSEAIGPDLLKLRTDLQERLMMLKGWTDAQEDEARAGKVEKQPRRDDRFTELESASDPERNTLPQFLAKLQFALKKVSSPIPELPLTGPRATTSALFRRGYRLFAVENNRVKKEAAARVNHVVEPLVKLGRTPADNEALAQYYRLHNALQRAELDAPRRAAIMAQMRKLEETKLNADPYNLFRKLVLYKDLRWRATYLKNDQGKPITLPMGLTVDEVASELRRTYKLIEQHPDGLAITEALRRHYKLTDDLQKSILEHGEIIPESLRNPLFYPHHVLDHWTGQTARVRPQTEEDFRKYLIAPKGSPKLIQADYLKAMMLHTADVLAHNARVDLVDKYWKPYDISEQLKAQHGDKWTMPWNIPAGYKLYSPYKKLALRMDYVLSREVLADKLGVLFNDGDLRARMGDAGRVVKVTPEDLHAALVAGEKIQWALPEEIADALDGIDKREKEAAYPGMWHDLAAPVRYLHRRWKQVKLFAPWSWVRYEYGNLTTDLIDKVLIADPGTAKQMARARKEIWNADRGEQSPEFKAALREGILETITEGEMANLSRLPEFEAFQTPAERRASKSRAVLESSMRGSRFREQVFRYAKFLADVERLRKGEQPVFGGAYHGDITALGQDVDGQRRMLDGEELIYAQAAEISLKTYGDYESISVFSQFLRTYIAPFWSWQDVNFRYHANLLRNVADALAARTMPRSEAARQIGGATVSALTKAGIRVGVMLFLYSAAQELWNRVGGVALGLWDDDDKLEDKLSEADRRRSHVILGQDKNGKVLVAYTPGAFADVAEWVGGTNLKRLFMEYATGQITLDVMIRDYAKSLGGDFINKAAQGASPVIKGGYELMSGKATFPDVLDQRNIPDSEKYWRLVGQLTDDRAVNVLRATFDQDYYSQPPAEQLQQIILQIRRRDPLQWSYFEVREDASEWKLRTKGKKRDGGDYTSPEAQALRNFRKAIYRGDAANAEKFYTRLLEFGYTQERLESSIRSQHPLNDLNAEERTEYLKTLTAKQQAELKMAMTYYESMLELKSGKSRSKDLFPRNSATGKPTPKTELLKRLVEEQKR